MVDVGCPPQPVVVVCLGIREPASDQLFPPADGIGRGDIMWVRKVSLLSVVVAAKATATVTVTGFGV